MTLAVERVESRPLLGLRELRRLPDARLSDGWVESLLAMPADEGLWFDNHYASLQWKNRDHNTKACEVEFGVPGRTPAACASSINVHLGTLAGFESRKSHVILPHTSQSSRDCAAYAWSDLAARLHTVQRICL
jgi:hypothetical protein